MIFFFWVLSFLLEKNKINKSVLLVSLNSFSGGIIKHPTFLFVFVVFGILTQAFMCFQAFCSCSNALLNMDCKTVGWCRLCVFSETTFLWSALFSYISVCTRYIRVEWIWCSNKQYIHIYYFVASLSNCQEINFMNVVQIFLLPSSMVMAVFCAICWFCFSLV